MRFYTNPNASDEHLWLIEQNGMYLFVQKGTDRWSPVMPTYFEKSYVGMTREKVPVSIRSKAGQRLGGYKRHL